MIRKYLKSLPRIKITKRRARLLVEAMCLERSMPDNIHEGYTSPKVAIEGEILHIFVEYLRQCGVSEEAIYQGGSFEWKGLDK